ncbi:uncharacterized protein BCR38DRAFT_481478 [Pseudomassariella vexata]|uniref:Uncharacterized protein n=1 Tax=Pseudomassariella vexata TaxID=1141098 RepID=A0A1Y2EGB0_9PEZI|nr:uncharacterized protein BCR38DRAFT_481478 [Pseudomassariella vexata]ORY70344.1 hypothetical protein BCR38DRAFT_481478 [Pseudomassariella vexata]
MASLWRRRFQAFLEAQHGDVKDARIPVSKRYDPIDAFPTGIDASNWLLKFLADPEALADKTFAPFSECFDLSSVLMFTAIVYQNSQSRCRGRLAQLSKENDILLNEIFDSVDLEREYSDPDDRVFSHELLREEAATVVARVDTICSALRRIEDIRVIEVLYLPLWRVAFRALLLGFHKEAERLCSCMRDESFNKVYFEPSTRTEDISDDHVNIRWVHGLTLVVQRQWEEARCEFLLVLENKAWQKGESHDEAILAERCFAMAQHYARKETRDYAAIRNLASAHEGLLKKHGGGNQVLAARWDVNQAKRHSETTQQDGDTWRDWATMEVMEQYGEEHLATYVTRLERSLFLSRAGNHQKVIDLQSALLEKYPQLVASGVPIDRANTIVVELALNYYRLGMVDAGNNVTSTMLQNMDALLGQEHEDTLACLTKYINMVRGVGVEMSIEILARICGNLKRDPFEPTHSHRLMAMHCELGHQYRTRRDYNIAVKYYRQLVDAAVARLGIDKSVTQDAYLWLFECFWIMELVKEAKDVADQVIDMLKERGPANKRQILNWQGRLCSLECLKFDESISGHGTEASELSNMVSSQFFDLNEGPLDRAYGYLYKALHFFFQGKAQWDASMRETNHALHQLQCIRRTSVLRKDNSVTQLKLSLYQRQAIIHAKSHNYQLAIEDYCQIIHVATREPMYDVWRSEWLHMANIQIKILESELGKQKHGLEEQVPLLVSSDSGAVSRSNEYPHNKKNCQLPTDRPTVEHVEHATIRSSFTTERNKAEKKELSPTTKLLASKLQEQRDQSKQSMSEQVGTGSRRVASTLPHIFKRKATISWNPRAMDACKAEAATTTSHDKEAHAKLTTKVENNLAAVYGRRGYGGDPARHSEPADTSKRQDKGYEVAKTADGHTVSQIENPQISQDAQAMEKKSQSGLFKRFVDGKQRAVLNERKPHPHAGSGSQPLNSQLQIPRHPISIEPMTPLFSRLRSSKTPVGYSESMSAEAIKASLAGGSGAKLISPLAPVKERKIVKLKYEPLKIKLFKDSMKKPDFSHIVPDRQNPENTQAVMENAQERVSKNLDQSSTRMVMHTSSSCPRGIKSAERLPFIPVNLNNTGSAGLKRIFLKGAGQHALQPQAPKSADQKRNEKEKREFVEIALETGEERRECIERIKREETDWDVLSDECEESAYTEQWDPEEKEWQMV